MDYLIKLWNDCSLGGGKTQTELARLECRGVASFLCDLPLTENNNKKRNTNKGKCIILFPQNNKHMPGHINSTQKLQVNLNTANM